MTRSPVTGCVLGCRHKTQCSRQVWLQIFTMNHSVQHAMLEQELTALKTFRQFLPNRLFDDAWTGKTDESSGLSNIEIAQHCVRRSYAASCRIREYRNVRKAGIVQPAECSRDLRHLHQRTDAFHHPRASRRGNNDQRFAFLKCSFDGASNSLTNHCAHAAADKAIFHRAGDYRLTVQHAFSVNNCVLKLSFFLRFAQTIFVSFGVNEGERVSGTEICLRF